MSWHLLITNHIPLQLVRTLQLENEALKEELNSLKKKLAKGEKKKHSSTRGKRRAKALKDAADDDESARIDRLKAAGKKFVVTQLIWIVPSSVLTKKREEFDPNTRRGKQALWILDNVAKVLPPIIGDGAVSKDDADIVSPSSSIHLASRSLIISL
jgi:hypothetical protein